MTHIITSRPGLKVALFALASVGILLFQIHGSAGAAEITKGSASITISSGKAGKVSAIGQAKLTRRIGKQGARIKSPVSGSTFDSVVGARVAGGIRLANGKRKITISGMNVVVKSNRVVLKGKLGGQSINVFNASGKTVVDASKGTASLAGGKLSLTRAAAAKVRKALKLTRAPKGRIGSLALKFEATFVDQYNEQCGVEVASRSIDSWPAASALPGLSGAVATSTSNSINWGFLGSFRGYLYGAMSGAGKADKALQALDGASRANPPMNPTRGFTFPVADGQYAKNSLESTTDDQAVINGSGTALFCNTEHFFWVSISDPTIVIDGANSRIVATVSQNTNGNAMFGEFGPWQTPQRIDLADLDLTSITPVYSDGGNTITYTGVPAKLSSDAAPIGVLYQAGDDLDPITLTIGL